MAKVVYQENENNEEMSLFLEPGSPTWGNKREILHIFIKKFEFFKIIVSKFLSSKP
jgi:hypothetical protein